MGASWAARGAMLSIWRAIIIVEMANRRVWICVQGHVRAVVSMFVFGVGMENCKTQYLTCIDVRSLV